MISLIEERCSDVSGGSDQLFEDFVFSPEERGWIVHFTSLGMTIDQAEAGVYGWIRTSLIEEGYNENDRWHALRADAAECQINALFY